MAQISFTDLVNGVVPDASDFNTRLNALKNRINNGMESDNIAALAVGTPALQNDAVTLAKLADGTLGGLLYYGTAGAPTELAGNTTTTKKYLTQTGNGSASAAPAWSSLAASDLPAGSVIQMVNTQTGAFASSASTIPNSDAIPQNTQGVEVMTRSITPSATTNKLRIDVVVYASEETDGGNVACVALFQDSTANALAAGRAHMDSGVTTYGPIPIVFTHYMDAGTTSATTFKVRAGMDAGTININGTAGARKLGGVMASSITITEIKV